MNRLVLLAATLLVCAPVQAHGDNHVAEHDVYTLYRTSYIGGETSRVHVATFDSRWGNEANRKACELTRDLYLNRPDETEKYWCEAGYVNFER
jgi:hypothetical protein